MLPLIALNKDIQQTEIEWATEFVDIPDSSKLRVLTGIKLMLFVLVIYELKVHT